MPGKEFDVVLGCDYFSAYHKYMRDFNMAKRFGKNGRYCFEFILAAVHAHFHGEPEPSLLHALGSFARHPPAEAMSG